MADSITTTFQHSYHKAFMMLQQQMQTRLRTAVMNYPTDGEAIDVPQIASTTAQEVSGSQQSTSAISMTTYNRRINVRRFNHPMLVDRFDQQRTVVDLKSPYVKTGVAAMNRKIDELIIQAATDNALTGKYGTSVTAFDTNMVVTAGSGLTTAKILEAKKLLDAEENDPSIPRYFVITAAGLEDLLGNTEVTSADYNLVKPLYTGEVDFFAGFKFVRSEQLEDNGSGVKSYLAFCEDAIGLAVGKDIFTEVGPRRDLNNTMQIYLEFMLGASRLREKGVVQINVTE